MKKAESPNNLFFASMIPECQGLEAMVSLEEKEARRTVQKQAERTGGFISLPLYRDGRLWHVINVPQNPFLLWSLGTFQFETYGRPRPPWELVATRGWKTTYDDPYHTDWMLGACVPLNSTYDRHEDSLGAVVRYSSAALRSKLVDEWTGMKFSVLSSGRARSFYGTAVHPKPFEGCSAGSFAIVSNAGPEYQLAMETACRVGGTWNQPGVLICEAGGKLAHLAIVGRELQYTILLVPNALTLYRPKTSMHIDLKAGLITINL